MSLTVLNLTEARREAAAAIAAQLRAPRSALRAPAIEAASPVLFQSLDKDGFRRISTSNSGRDLSPPMQDRMQAVCFYLYATNPLAQRLIETTKDYVVGEGITLKSDDEMVQAELDKFVDDSTTDLALNLHEYVKELGIFGELCLYAPSNPINGDVRLFYVDPSNIDAVEYASSTGLPGIAIGQPLTVVLRKQAGETAGRRLEIIRRDEDPYSPTFGQLVGDCHYFALNKARAATRGIGDLFAVADMIDGYDQMLYGLMEQVRALAMFIWDVEMQGTTQEQIEEWLRKNSAPAKPGSVRVHNEKVKWQAVAPHLNAADKSEAVRLIKNMVLGGRAWPEHWFAEGGTTNRATALEQGEPTLKMLTTRQLFVRRAVTKIAGHLVDRKIATGVLPEGVDRKVKVETPELSARDQAKAAGALQSAMSGLGQAQAAHAVDRKTITRFVSIIGQSMGLEIDVDEVLAAADGEKQEAELTDYRNLVPCSKFQVPSSNPEPADA